MIRLALGSLAFLGYTYAGYPLLIGALARIAPREVRADPGFEPTVTVLMPVLDAESYLEAKMDSLLEQDYPRDKLDVVVLSDGSTDGSDEIVRRRIARGERVTLLRNERRAGKPTALNRLRRAATGDVLALCDARQRIARGAVRALVSPLADPTVGCVSGNLVLAGEAGAGAYWRYEKWIRSAEARFRSLVGVTGALYAIRREDFHDLPADVILDDMWTPLRVRLTGRRIVIAEDAVAHDEAFADDREWARKVRTLAGNYQLFWRMPELLLPWENPSWLELVSHKVFRLACPAALAALLGASLAGGLGGKGSGRALSRSILRVLGAGQLSFYALAALGPRAGRAGGLARTFVVMNAAAAAGAYRFARGSQSVRW